MVRRRLKPTHSSSTDSQMMTPRQRVRWAGLIRDAAAASVLAKTARDALMQEWDAAFPGYGFSRHKGYGTAVHRAALISLGPCALHRRSFAPLKTWSEIENQPRPALL